MPYSEVWIDEINYFQNSHDVDINKDDITYVPFLKLNPVYCLENMALDFTIVAYKSLNLTRHWA
jgi:hypothetical protein